MNATSRPLLAIRRHPFQRRWAGGLRWGELVTRTVRETTGEPAVDLPPPLPRGPATELFAVGYLALTGVHALYVAIASFNLRLAAYLAPLPRAIRTTLTPLFLGAVPRNRAKITIEIGKSLPPPSGRCVLWIPDLQHRQYPEYFKFSEWLNREINWRASYYLADRAIASSESVSQDLHRLWGPMCPIDCWKFPASAGSVASPAATVSAPEPYIAYPAQFWKHKGHLDLCDAFHRLVSRRPDIPIGLTFVGREGPMTVHVRRWIVSHGLNSRCRVLTDVSDEALMAILSGARCLILPSHFEGWSTTLLEAIQSGRPVILSDIPAHREVGLPDAAYFPTRNPEALAATLERAIDDPAFRQEIVSSYPRLSLPSPQSFGAAVRRTIDTLTSKPVHS